MLARSSQPRHEAGCVALGAPPRSSALTLMSLYSWIFNPVGMRLFSRKWWIILVLYSWNIWHILHRDQGSDLKNRHSNWLISINIKAFPAPPKPPAINLHKLTYKAKQMHFMLLQMLPSAGPGRLWTEICSKTKSKAASSALPPGVLLRGARGEGRAFPQTERGISVSTVRKQLEHLESVGRLAINPWGGN